MLNSLFEIFNDLVFALGETGLMLLISTALSIVVGLPLGVFLFVTERGLFLENRFLNEVSGLLVNMVRSIPFVILLVLLLPFTRLVTGTTIGPVAASVSLSVAAIAFFARLAQGALSEIDPGIIEAATAMGAKPFSIITGVLLHEALPGLVRAVTVTVVSLVGYSAMSGTVGGGGVGDLAIRYGYYRYRTDVMITTVAVLIVLVQIIQIAGDRWAARIEKR